MTQLLWLMSRHLVLTFYSFYILINMTETADFSIYKFYMEAQLPVVIAPQLFSLFFFSAIF